MATLLILATLTNGYAAGTPRQKLTDAERRELCARALAEAEAAEAHVAALEARLDTARQQLAAASERANLSDAQVAALKEQVALYESSLKLARDQVEILRKDLDRVREERDDARRSRWTVGAVALLVGALIGFAAADH